MEENLKNIDITESLCFAPETINNSSFTLTVWEADWESVMGVSPACLFISTCSLRQVSHGIDPSPQRLWVIAVPPILTGEGVWGPAAFPSRDPCGAQVGAPSGGAELCCGGCSACLSHPQMLILRAHPANFLHQPPSQRRPPGPPSLQQGLAMITRPGEVLQTKEMHLVGYEGPLSGGS